MKSRQKLSEYLVLGLAYLAPILVFSLLMILIGYLFWQGIDAINLSLFFGDTPALLAILGQVPVWEGIWPACMGTLCLMGLTMLFALPPGIGCGIYLAVYARTRVKAVLGYLVDSLAGMPSILMGLFGFTLIVFLRQTLLSEVTTGLLLAAFCLSLLVLPVIIVGTRTAIEGLPAALTLNGIALGYHSGQIVWHILLPAASRGILSAVLLAVGRAAEDTAVIMLTGVVANAGLPAGLNAKFEALPFVIYYTSAQYQDLDELHRAFATSLILLIIVSALWLSASYLHYTLRRRWQR